MTPRDPFNLTVTRRSTLATLALAAGFVFATVAGTMVAFVALRALGMERDPALLTALALAVLALGFGMVALAGSASAPCRFVLKREGIEQTFVRTGATLLVPWDAVVSVRTERHRAEAGGEFDELTIEVREGFGRDIVLQERPSDGGQIAAFRRFREAVVEGRRAAGAKAPAG